MTDGAVISMVVRIVRFFCLKQGIHAFFLHFMASAVAVSRAFCKFAAKFNSMMNLHEAIAARRSVRRYLNKSLPTDVVDALKQKIEEVNIEGNLHVQLILDEPKAFKGVFAYGKFSNVTNYLVVCGTKAPDLDERVGYYGEKLVLLAQQLGLNTCWVGLSYHKVPGTYVLEADEKVACYIALGYGENQGAEHKRKSLEQISNISANTPEWFRKGIEAVRLAPTAVNQQKFYFEYLGVENGRALVRAKRLFSIIGYTQMDLGIARLHFEIGAGSENFEWAES